MSNRVTYDAKTAFGALLAEAVDGLVETTAKVDRIKRAMDAMALDAGSGPTWGRIESEFGVTPGEGQTIYNLVGDALQKLTAANVRTFTDRLDQG